MPPAKYVQRIARLPEVFEVLAAHPDGLPLASVADTLDVPPDELREDLLAFFAADVGVLLGLSGPASFEFLGSDGEEEDPATADVLRLVDERPTEELGVEHVDASELALIYAAAQALLEIEPMNDDLAGAVDVIAETLFGGTADAADLGIVDGAPEQTTPDAQPLAILRQAVTQHRRVRIHYSRAWQPGVTERVIDPYLLVQTRRGWEVDAGPPDRETGLRTFLISHVRSAELTDQTFDPPAELDRLLKEQRATTTVRVQVPHTARWAADMYAERVEVIDDDERSVVLDLELLPPVRERIGRLLLASGSQARVLDPAHLVAAAAEVAGVLLDHHRGDA